MLHGVQVRDWYRRHVSMVSIQVVYTKALVFGAESVCDDA